MNLNLPDPKWRFKKNKNNSYCPEDENHLDNSTTGHKSHIFVGHYDGNIALQY